MKYSDKIYQLNGRVPLLQALPFGLQHVLAMFVSNITPIIILANVIGIEKGLTASLIQNCMIIASIGTLIQLYPVWKIGSRLPIVMGISFTFLSVSISIAASQGMGVLVGAVIVGGIVEGILGLFAKYWLKLIPHIVAATVVTSIGFSLLPIGANSFAGGQGARTSAPPRTGLSAVSRCLPAYLPKSSPRGSFLRSLSVLVGLVAGYILALCMGMVDFSGITSNGLFALPKILPFTPEFDLGAILSVVAIFLVSATETVGDSSALCSSALKRQIHKNEIGGAVSCDGFVSTISGIFGCTPITSFSQNVGLAALSGVVNRFAIATSAGIMLLGGIFPPVGALLTTIPQSVLGGCTIMMFGSILFAGFGMIAKSGFSQRNMIIVSLSLSIGLGFTSASKMFQIFPQIIQTIFAENCVAVVFILAVFLNLVLPKDKEEAKQE